MKANIKTLFTPGNGNQAGNKKLAMQLFQEAHPEAEATYLWDKQRFLLNGKSYNVGAYCSKEGAFISTPNDKDDTHNVYEASDIAVFYYDHLDGRMTTFHVDMNLRTEIEKACKGRHFLPWPDMYKFATKGTMKTFSYK